MEMLVGKLKLSGVLEKPQTHLTVDFITKLLLVAGKDAILVVCNRLFKMMHFVETTEEILVERLVRLFRDNMWKLHELLESVVSNRELQFVMELTKKLNRMLGIQMKLLIAFYSQINNQIEKMNQELEQYLRFFFDYKQKDWPEWLVSVEFIVNNKAHSATKVSLFMVNYSRELRMRVNIRKKEKMEKAMKFAKRMRRVREEAEAVLKKVQKEMKRQVDRRRKKVEI